MVHLELAGTGGDGHALPGLQEAAREHLSRLLQVDRDRLSWHLLRQAQAGEGHARGRGAAARLLEEGAVGGHPLELGWRGGAWEEEKDVPFESQASQGREAGRSLGGLGWAASGLQEPLLGCVVAVGGGSLEKSPPLSKEAASARRGPIT